MPTVTMSLPEEVKKQMEEFPEINWSEVSRAAILEKLRRLSLLKKLDKMLENSELSEEDCIRLGDEIKQKAWEKLKKEGW